MKPTIIILQGYPGGGKTILGDMLAGDRTVEGLVLDPKPRGWTVYTTCVEYSLCIAFAEKHRKTHDVLIFTIQNGIILQQLPA